MSINAFFNCADREQTRFRVVRARSTILIARFSRCARGRQHRTSFSLLVENPAGSMTKGGSFNRRASEMIHATRCFFPRAIAPASSFFSYTPDALPFLLLLRIELIRVEAPRAKITTEMRIEITAPGGWEAGGRRGTLRDSAAGGCVRLLFGKSPIRKLRSQCAGCATYRNLPNEGICATCRSIHLVIDDRKIHTPRFLSL